MGAFQSLFNKPPPLHTQDTNEIVDQEMFDNEVVFSQKGVKKALLVGINYQKDASTTNDLNGCVNDVNHLFNYITNNCYFAEKDITVLCNAQDTTKENIQNELRDLVYFSYRNPNSELWFSYSGHGAGMFSMNEQDKQCEVLCPSDYGTNGFIYDTWLREYFVNRLHPSTKLFILMDCCHSGTNVNLPYQLIDHKETEITTKNNALLANVIKISGCQDAQTSMESYQQDTQEFRGALTNAFIQNATEFKGTIFHVLCDNVRKDLQDKGFKQVPMLSFSQLGDSKWSLF